MFNKQLKRNIKELDVRIGKLYEELNKAESEDERKQIMEQVKELANLRSKLSTVKTREALAPILVPALVGITTMFMVIRHEETNIITSKALGIAQKFIKGGQ